jgi:hypothetical protein
MRRRLTSLLILSCFGALFLTCYAPVLFRDHQFAFRDASNYYYWLNKRVQSAWDMGRWPLWEPEENAGMPLLGNPTAAVLYPGKLVFAVLPYAWGARAYILAHSALAFLSMLVLMRSWGTSRFGSALSAMAYTFGGPVLFQYSNVIYLIGAAWLPLGVHAADRWVRLGRRWGIVELAIVLSMQTLGGDVQSAYLLGAASMGYALGLAWTRHRAKGAVAGTGFGLWQRWRLPAVGAIALVLWCVFTVVLAQWLPKLRPPGNPPPPLRWMAWVPLGVLLVWGLIAVGFLFHWRGRAWRSPFGAMSLGLAGAATLSAVLTAAQLLPVIEFTQRTGRSRAIPDEVYKFTLEPHRLAELAWPNVMGTPFQSNDYWGHLVRIPGGRQNVWIPTLYLGGLTLALAVSALAVRRGPPWRVWLTGIAGLSLVGALGQYSSPIWMVRALDATLSSRVVRDWLPDIGPIDMVSTTAIRHDGYLRDSDGSAYWWMATILPGFRQFRYPAKLLSLTALAAAALAGLGWDRLGANRARGTVVVFSVLLVATLATLAVVTLRSEPILAFFRTPGAATFFGPFDAAAGYRAIMGSLCHAAVVFGVGLLLASLARKRPVLSGTAVVILVAADLAAANSRYVLTAPQSVFDTKPEVASAIEDAERADRAPGPFRIHRMRSWHPSSWVEHSSKDRVKEVASWERDTLAPNSAIGYGLEYTHTQGFGELDEYDRFFATFNLTIRQPQVAQSLGITPGEAVVYFSRRAYDLWNTRYVIVPMETNGWRDPERSSAPFLFQSTQVYPNVARFVGPDGSEHGRNWAATRDFRVLRNLAEYPRAWVVHDARVVSDTAALSQGPPRGVMQEILFAEDPIWRKSRQPVYDPHRLAWMAESDLGAIRDYLSGQTTENSETVRVTYPSPEQAVLEATLVSPGLVVLADIDYPGWELAIDGMPAPIYRVNLLMRGAAVSAGRHRLVYTYTPQSFRIGRVISMIGLAALLLVSLACWRRPVVAILADQGQSIDSDT